jgi:excisionase family DNA binding protein
MPGMIAMPQDQYQTVQQVADRLAVAEATVRQWIKSGALRAIDIGKGWRIADTDLALFLTRRETAPRSAPDTGPSPGPGLSGQDRAPGRPLEK